MSHIITILGAEDLQQKRLGTMTKISKRSLIAAAISMGAVISIQTVSADPLNDIHKEEAKTHSAAIQSQNKINTIFEQTQELLGEYRTVVDETENLKVYNDYLASLVADQQAGIDQLQREIDSIEDTKQGIVPLMIKMIDSLEKFINLDVPIKIEDRLARVERLRALMSNSSVTTSEQFRQVLEAYLIENSYGASVQTPYQTEISINGAPTTVEIFNMGRVVLLALSLDQKTAWYWNKGARAWEQLGSEYLSSVVKANRMARKIEPFDLIKLPIDAAE